MSNLTGFVAAQQLIDSPNFLDHLLSMNEAWCTTSRQRTTRSGTGKDVPSQGFDPRKLADVLFNKAVDPRTRSRDVVTMIIIGIERGNNIDKMLMTMSPAGQAIVRDLKSKYGLVNSVGGNRPMAITLSRICLVFPTVTCDYLRTAKNPTVGRPGMEKHVPNYPYELMHSAFATLIPHAEDFPADTTTHLIRAHVLHQILFSEIINRPSPRSRPREVKTARDFLNSALNLAKVAVMGDYCSFKTRLSYCSNRNIIYGNEPCTEVVLASVALEKYGAEAAPSAYRSNTINYKVTNIEGIEDNRPLPAPGAAIGTSGIQVPTTATPATFLESSGESTREQETRRPAPGAAQPGSKGKRHAGCRKPCELEPSRLSQGTREPAADFEPSSRVPSLSESSDL